MSVRSEATAARGFTRRRRASEVNPHLRISDAERAEVADRLARHYGDGRLDQAEFNQRLDQTMKAKTQSDLNGLLADLPGTPSTGAPARPGRGRRVLMLLLVIVIAAAAWHALVHWSYIGLLLTALLVLVWLRHSPARHRRS